MAIENNKLAQIAGELNDIQKALAKTIDQLQTIGAAIDKAQTDEPTIVSNTKFHGELSDLIAGLQLIDAEQNKLQANFETIKGNNEESVVQVLKHKLQDFGCSLLLSQDADNKMLYKFDFGQGRCITTTVVDSHLTLVEICPESTKFAEIKAFLDESQDLLGMLAIFGDTYSTAV